MKNSPHLPPGALEAYFSTPVKSYLGRARLFPEGYEAFGTSVLSLAACTRPLMFEEQLDVDEKLEDFCTIDGS